MNLHIENIDVIGGSHTGGLTGMCGGEMQNISVSGRIQGKEYVGGLVGYNTGEIRNSSSDTSTIGVKSVGGLAGYNQDFVIDCYSTGEVSGNDRIGGVIGIQLSRSLSRYLRVSTLNSCTSSCQIDATGISAGGLVGECGGQVTDCNATGNVSGHERVGGLIGYNRGSLHNSFATGDITADSNSVGGLVGLSYPVGDTTTNCYATGDVQAVDNVGGLVGECSGAAIKQCYSLSKVTGRNNIGGLVGRARYPIQSSYAMGDVLGQDYVGGLVGLSSDPVIGCYSTGRVSGDRHVGGFIGWAWFGEVESCFWDVQKSQQSRGEGYSRSLEGIIGKTTTEMKTADTFLEAGWDFVGEIENGTEDIWWILEGQDYPRLWWETDDN